MVQFRDANGIPLPTEQSSPRKKGFTAEQRSQERLFTMEQRCLMFLLRNRKSLIGILDIRLVGCWSEPGIRLKLMFVFNLFHVVSIKTCEHIASWEIFLDLAFINRTV